MPRTHIIQSWVGAAEYDEGDTYNGEQIGNRNQKSIGVHITRSGDQWYANPQAYVDEKPKTKAKPSAFSQICTADKTYEKLCHLSETLDSELDSKQISWEDYIYARKQLDVKLERSWEAVKRLRGWTNEDTPVQPHSFELTLDTEALRSSQVDMSIIPCDSVFHSLKDDNLFKIGYSLCLTGVNKLSRLWNVGKQLVQEGLI